MEAGPSPLARLLAHVATVGFAALVLSVLAFEDHEEAFPLSRYPMFAFPRPRQEGLPFVQVHLADGSTKRLGYQWWTHGGVGTARNQLARLAKAPQADRASFCEALATRVAASDEPWAAGAERVSVLAGRFQPRRIVHDGDAEPLDAHPIVGCALPGGG